MEKLLLSTDDAAAALGMSPRTLERWRIEGRGPSYVRLGSKLVGYEREALRAFVEQGRRLTTRVGELV